MKRAADNKRRYAPGKGSIPPFVVWGFQRGSPFGTRLCSQSVVCYTLCRRCCENAVAAGEGKGIFTAGKQGCDCAAWSRKRRTGFISRQGYMKALVPRRTSGQNILNLWTHSRQGRRIFLSKLKWAGSHFRAFPP